jgi:hypothetical protein
MRSLGPGSPPGYDRTGLVPGPLPAPETSPASRHPAALPAFTDARENTLAPLSMCPARFPATATGRNRRARVGVSFPNGLAGDRIPLHDTARCR